VHVKALLARLAARFTRTPRAAAEAPAARAAPAPRRTAGVAPTVGAQEVAYLDGLRAAQVSEKLPRSTWALYLLAATVAAGIAWAALTRVDEITRADARVVPDGREQLIASLEGGILRELHVREGMQVQAGQELAQLDPTRAESQQKENEGRRVALRGTLARLEAESRGSAPAFPPEVKAVASIVHAETEAYEARQRALYDAVGANGRSIALLERELNVSAQMAARGLMSEVEVMRLRRQVNELQMQGRERINRFRQEASTELIRVRNELAQLEEQLVVREDALKRTVLTSPVRGLVKTIKVATLGGVVAPGAPIMEIVPIGSRVLVEARIKPRDIGFVRVGQKALVKLSAYDYTVYGALEGRIESLSPDAIGDPDRLGGAEATYYRATIRAERSGLKPDPRSDGGVTDPFGSWRKKKAKNLPVIPGMTGTVEVHTGERSVLSFLMRPMMKSQEAFTER
jgi:adhesin transport system membrane fusion protein